MVLQKGLSNHTPFSKHMRREAEGQLRDGVSVEKVSTKLLFLSSVKNDFLE